MMARAELTERDVQELRQRLDRIRKIGSGSKLNEQVRLIGCIIRKGERKAMKDVPKKDRKIRAEIIDAADLFDDETLKLF